MQQKKTGFIKSSKPRFLLPLTLTANTPTSVGRFCFTCVFDPTTSR